LSRVVLLSEVGQYLCEVQEFKPVQVYGKAANLGALSHGKQLTRHVADVARQKYEGIKLKTLAMLPADEMNALIPTYTTKAINEATETYLLETHPAVNSTPPMEGNAGTEYEDEETVGELTEEEKRKSFGNVYTQGNV
jgi:hypothetical protein